MSLLFSSLLFSSPDALAGDSLDSYPGSYYRLFPLIAKVNIPDDVDWVKPLPLAAMSFYDWFYSGLGVVYHKRGSDKVVVAISPSNLKKYSLIDGDGRKFIGVVYPYGIYYDELNEQIVWGSKIINGKLVKNALDQGYLVIQRPDRKYLIKTADSEKVVDSIDGLLSVTREGLIVYRDKVIDGKKTIYAKNLGIKEFIPTLDWQGGAMPTIGAVGIDNDGNVSLYITGWGTFSKTYDYPDALKRYEIIWANISSYPSYTVFRVQSPFDGLIICYGNKIEEIPYGKELRKIAYKYPIPTGGDVDAIWLSDKHVLLRGSISLYINGPTQKFISADKGRVKVDLYTDMPAVKGYYEDFAYIRNIPQSMLNSGIIEAVDINGKITTRIDPYTPYDYFYIDFSKLKGKIPSEGMPLTYKIVPYVYNGDIKYEVEDNIAFYSTYWVYDPSNVDISQFPKLVATYESKLDKDGKVSIDNIVGTVRLINNGNIPEDVTCSIERHLQDKPSMVLEINDEQQSTVTVSVGAGEEKDINIVSIVSAKEFPYMYDGVVTCKWRGGILKKGISFIKPQVTYYKITTNIHGGGKIDLSVSDPNMVAKGTEVSFTVTASEGWHISQVKVNKDVIFRGKDNSDDTYNGTFKIEKDTNIEAYFEKDVYSIEAEASQGGTIEPSGVVKIKYGENITFVITPDEDHEIEAVYVDGVNIGNPKEYIFTNVRANHTIRAVFKRATTRIYLKPGDKHYKINDKTYVMDVAPFIDPRFNRTVVPLRFIGEAIGLDVKWDNDTRTVKIKGETPKGQLELAIPMKNLKKQKIKVNGKDYEIHESSGIVYVNGKNKDLVKAGLGKPFIYNGRTFVPLRFIIELFGGEVVWHADTRTIELIFKY